MLCSSIVHPVIGYSALVTAFPYLVGALTRMSGGGDLKLAVVIGGLVAEPGLGALTVLMAAIIHLTGRRPRDHLRRPRPHAPSLVVASAVALGLG